MTDEEYIGDGLYVRFDGFGFWLRAPREGGDHEVYLESDMIDNFNKFVEKIKQQEGK